MPSKPKSRRFTFTSYDKVKLNENINAWIEDIDYYCGSPEICPSTGRPHIQGYIEWKNRITVATCAGRLSCACFIAHGTAIENAIYCGKSAYVRDGKSKEANPEFKEWGKPTKQGERGDLDYIKELALKEGMSAVVEATNSYQAIRVAEKYLIYKSLKRTWKPEVIWLTGNTGEGKSHVARKMFAGVYYVKKDGTKWWEGYDGQENLIIDDFRGSWWSFTDMLSILDRYEHIVEFKGGSRQLLAKKIIVTSIHYPKECYKNMGEDINQLLRRIDKVYIVKREGNDNRLTLVPNDSPTIIGQPTIGELAGNI